MSISRRPLLLAALGLFAVAVTAHAAAPDSAHVPPLTIAQQIDGLLRRRLKPEPLPLDLPNPFVMAAKDLSEAITTSTVATSETPNPAPIDPAKPVANADVLADAISRLHFGGVLRLKDQVQLVINDTPRKEGEVLKVPWSGTQLLIRVQRISSTEVVLRYLDVEATVRF